jgi:hypothetical protein
MLRRNSLGPRASLGPNFGPVGSRDENLRPRARRDRNFSICDHPMRVSTKVENTVSVLSREPHLDRGPTYGAIVTRGRQSINTSRARVPLARLRARTTPRWNVYAAEFLRGAPRPSQHQYKRAKHKSVPYHSYVAQAKLITKLSSFVTLDENRRSSARRVRKPRLAVQQT